MTFGSKLKGFFRLGAKKINKVVNFGKKLPHEIEKFAHKADNIVGKGLHVTHNVLNTADKLLEKTKEYLLLVQQHQN